MSRLPVWFVSHGAPDIVMADNNTTRVWAELAQSLESHPAMVLCVSAHWESSETVLAGIGSDIQYDFGGFAPELYERRWPLVDARDAAQWLSEQLSLPGTGVPGCVKEGNDVPIVPRALDHGVWVPLSRMWPQPDFPILQLSLSSTRGTDWHLALGRCLAPLRERGVLIIASGGVVHNLHLLDWSHPAGPVPPWAQSFVTALEGVLARGDEQALCDPWSLPGGRESVPTLEHYLPLLVASGASLPQPLTAVHRDWSHGSLALHVYAA